MSVNYVIGDATKPIQTAKQKHVIAHCCNNIGAWGRGFVLAVSALSPLPEKRYKAWHHGEIGTEFKPGMVQIVPIPDSNLVVANIIGQDGIRPKRDCAGNMIPPILYDDLEVGLRKTAMWASRHNADIHTPRIGCGLAGGDWSIIKDILERTSVSFGINIFFYDLTEKDKERYQ